MMHMLGIGDNGGAGTDFMGSVQTMGIINAMKTGDLRIDMFIAMLIPLFIRFAFDLFNRLNNQLNWENISKWWKTKFFKYERSIVYKCQRTSWGSTTNLGEDTQNTVLLKAVRFYLHQCCKLDFREATVDLTTMGQQQNTIDYYDYDDDRDVDEDEKTMVGTLSKYKIVPKPKDGTWHVVGSFDGHEVQIMVSEAEEEQNSGDTNNNNKSSTSTTTFHFVSTGKTSIDTFIQKAYDWYLDQLRSLEDHSRYLYEIRQTGKKSTEESSDSGGFTYNRYKLSDEKTFESLFFRQKKSLLTLIQHFQQKTGKYSIKGYPHKLGLLLHGVPGTGKTSLIKALAHHTGRSIVNIPLSKIETNSELMDIFFAKRYSVDGQDVPVKLGFKDVIFVLEDVDASSKVVKRRVAEAAPRPVVVAKSPWQMLLESNDDETREVVTLLKEQSERLSDAAKESDVLFSLAQRIGSVPGLGVICCKEVDRDTRDEAIQMADSTMSALETVDRFVTLHAKTIKALLESGTEISTAFEDALMGRVASHEIGIPSAFSFNSEQGTGEGDDAQQQMILQAALAISGEANATSNSNAMAAGPALFSKPKKDELNLSGLLNVLDGVVDTPGRIVIMTTNHPEQLDPALIRPGRIDKKIMLGYMNSLDMIEMVELYFQTTLDEEQTDRLRRIAGALSLTPAEIEQMAAENDLVEELLSQLEDRAGLTVATSETSSDFP